MGCFGYMCIHCGKSIRGGEQAVLKHIRHGEVMGETRGTYDSYGGVEECDHYRGHHDEINGHMSIWTSEFEFLDSEGFSGKIYKGEPITWMTYRSRKVSEGVKDLSQEIYDEWDTLEKYVQSEAPRSGTEAWHTYCYDRGKNTQELKEKHVISEGDPDQSWGKPRKKFMLKQG